MHYLVDVTVWYTDISPHTFPLRVDQIYSTYKAMLVAMNLTSI